MSGVRKMTPGRPWRRRLARAALCVLLGAVTTVGVAWSVAIRGVEPSFGYLPSDWEGPPGGMAAWFTDPPVDWPEMADYRDYAETRFITLRVAQSGVWWLAAQEAYRQTIVESGWPMRAMVSTWHTESSLALPPRPPTNPLARSPAERGLQVEWLTGTNNNTMQRMPRALPLLPIWPAFLVNTLFYAAPWWILLTAAGWQVAALMRWRRKRRGACLACGYDLRGLAREAACPECGR